MSSHCVIVYPAEFALGRKKQPYKRSSELPSEQSQKIVYKDLDPTKQEWVIAEKGDLTSKQHSEKIEAISTIAGGVAHNFRNTLTEILINSQVIQLKFKDIPGLHDVAERINTSVKKAAQLVDGLVQFSRNQTKEEFRNCDLTEVIKESCHLIRESFDKRIDITLDLPDSLPVFGDYSSLSQAIMNLCSNAQDAMPDGGILQIKARQESNNVQVTISDTGTGMDLKTIEKCFDPFFTTKPIGKGIGMGLSATYGIIKSHDGLFKVESRPGRGTTFKIQLPMATAGDNLPPESKSVPVNRRRLTFIDNDAQRINPQRPSLC